MLSYSNVIIGCLNAILIKYSLFLNVMKNIKKLPSEIKDKVGAEVQFDTEDMFVLII